MRPINPLNTIARLNKISTDDAQQLADKETKLLAKGQTLLADTDILTQSRPASPALTMQMSVTAQTLDQAIRQWPRLTAHNPYQASAIVSDHPQSATQMALSLKQAIDFSGLFYESHLQAFTLKARTLTAIQQEPHNQPNGPHPLLVAQQLEMLDHAQIAWQGQVWRAQPMTWHIRWPAPKDEKTHWRIDGVAAEVMSDLVLTLPRLGKVAAKVQLQHGRLRVSLQAQDPRTLDSFQAKSQQLAQAIKTNGQLLAQLTIQAYEAAPI